MNTDLTLYPEELEKVDGEGVQKSEDGQFLAWKNGTWREDKSYNFLLQWKGEENFYDQPFRAYII